jgi:putative ABC transport system ATP-binding protein
LSARPSPALLLADVHLRLGSGAAAVDVLRGLDLEIAPGERVGVVGASGSGKSTALMVACGLERVDSGLVAVQGRDLAGLDADRLAILRGETPT